MRNLLKTASAASLLCLAAGASLTAAPAFAADTAVANKNHAAQTQPYLYSDRQNMKAYSSEREALQAQLKPGMDAAAYRKQLTDLGYKITTVNEKEADYVEYEVVKGNVSHEIQIDLDKASRKATKVDVALNMWRSDATKLALSDKPYKTATTGDYSDRAYAKTWTDEKGMLEKALGTGHDKAYYAQQLKQLGYMVTSTNEREKDYLEYEIVKDNRTYEVQIDFDGGAQKATKVDVTTNLWNTAATDKALKAARKP